MRPSLVPPLAAIVASLGCAALGPLALGCGAPAPCTPASCGAGSTCVLGACEERSRVPVSDRARRIVVFPGDVAAVAENLPGGSHATLALGGRGPGDAAVYLAFAHGLARDVTVEAAWVVAEPATGAATASAWVEVEAREIAGPFRGGAVDWSRRPATGRPTGVGRTRGAAGSALRVEVTELVRNWVRSGRRDGRIALVARADTDVGATISTGLGAGAAPRLEVYLR